MIRVTSISNTDSDENVVKISAFADTKDEVVSGAKFVGLDDDAVIDMGSSIITAAGDLAFMKSDGTWSWVSSGGGGGSVLIPKTITQNGFYDPTDDNADGYNNVIVNVEGGGGGSKNILGGTTAPTSADGTDGDIYIRYGHEILSDFQIKKESSMTITANDSNIVFDYTGGSTIGGQVYKQFDLTNIDTISFSMTSGSHTYNNYQTPKFCPLVIIENTLNPASNFVADSVSPVEGSRITANNTNVTMDVDVSSLTGNYWIVFCSYGCDSTVDYLHFGEEEDSIVRAYLKVDGDWIILEDGDWSEVNTEGGGGGSTTYIGKTDPSPSQGHIGDYYIKYAIFNELVAVTRSYQLKITKGLRGSSELTYVGAQEIQLIYDDGNGNEVNIRTLANFTYSGSTGNSGYTNPAIAFDGDTGGYYWEANPTAVIVNFSATVPTNYTLKKFVVWQRSVSYTTDVWADFDLIETVFTISRTILSEKGLTVADWAGAGYGTEWDLSDISNPTEPIILGTYIKVGDTESTAEWTEHTLTVEFDAILTAKTITQNGTYNPASDNADGYSQVTVNVSGSEPTLPAEYQEVEYIDFVPHAGYLVAIPTDPIIIEACVTPKVDIANGEHSIIGYRVSSSSAEDFEMRAAGDNYSVWCRTSTYAGSYQMQASLDTKATYVGCFKGLSRPSAYIGRYANYSVNAYSGFYGYIHYIKIRNINGELLMKFVPCRKIGTEQFGFYEVVNGTFYDTPDTTGGGSVSVGPDVP